MYTYCAGDALPPNKRTHKNQTIYGTNLIGREGCPLIGREGRQSLRETLQTPAAGSHRNLIFGDAFLAWFSGTGRGYF